ncbi:hypothetical protein P7K49_026425 [Saguinus oedipus]|uniref:Uncharacterized protein n=1 Tax=Saguinus oedipus TaxID=9490 RepID=A0ABQ9UD52_SAGOE|nr:hypothetical protein P7K49_026425 [Saguinus oedipus]
MKGRKDFEDFTALLVDIIGNSTSYLTEIFKSTSILSVSQSNESDCIFICVMTGKSGRNLSDFWEMAEKYPVINYTFTSGMSGVLETAAPSEAEETLNTGQPLELPARATATWVSASYTTPALGPSGRDAGSPLSHLIPGAFTHGTQTASPTKATAPKDPQTGDLPAEWPFTPGEEPVLVPRPHQVSRCPQPLFKVGAMAAAPLTLAIQRLNPCLMELCHFFQQCLCMSQRSPRTEDMSGKVGNAKRQISKQLTSALADLNNTLSDPGTPSTILGAHPLKDSKALVTYKLCYLRPQSSVNGFSSIQAGTDSTVRAAALVWCKGLV